MIEAASRDLPPMPIREDFAKLHLEWLQKQPQKTKDQWLADVMSDPHSTTRSDLLLAFRKNRTASAWPTVDRKRTIAELSAGAEAIQAEKDRAAEMKAAIAIARRRAKIAADPSVIFQEVEQFVIQRKRTACEHTRSSRAIDTRNVRLIKSDVLETD